MKNLFTLLLAISLLHCTGNRGKEQSGNMVSDRDFQPHVEVLDSRLNEILDPMSKVEIIAEGFDWSEGPLWVDGLGLLFSDIPPNIIYLWTEEAGTKVYLKPSGYTGHSQRGGEVGSNGLLLDPEGQLVLCQHGDRRIAKMNASLDNPAPDYITIVENYEGKKFNSPNDACYSNSGELYFTDPPYGLEQNMDDPLKELQFQGIFKLGKDGLLELLTDEMSRPNGIALSPDNRTIYVANSDPELAIWRKFNLSEDAQIESSEIFYDATSLVGKEAGLPDGLKVDGNGVIFASGPGGVWVFNNDAEILGKIKTGQATSNCAIGNDGKILYITADMFVMKVNLKG